MRSSVIKAFKSLPRNPSPALLQALSHVKSFMTDVQKSLILLREGRLLFDAGDIKNALDCFSEAISFNPSVTLFNMRASCFKLLDMHSEAYFDYSYNIRLEPEVGAHYCNRGMCLAKLKKLIPAVEDLNLAIQYEPTGANYFARASIYADFGRFEEAVADFTMALKDDAINTGHDFKMKCRYRRSLAYFDLKNYEQAIADATVVLQQDPNSVPARSVLGRAFKVVNEYQKAEEQLSNAIIIDETQPTLFIERGDIRFRTGQRNKIIEAVYDLDKAVTLLEGKLAPLKNGNIYSAPEVVEKRLNRNASFAGFSGEEKSSRFHHSTSTSALTTNRHNLAPAVAEGQRKELEELLADALYKRAQAKLMVESDSVNIEAALSDAMKALFLSREDEDYQLVVATCYIRLRRYQDAVNVLEGILEKSPKNSKALYNLSFCRRAAGSQKEAIEGLTKIISFSQPDVPGSNTTIPIHRVYEMRGTLFHEVQAHKLALMDLGKAIAINPSHAGNYFLRGDCNSKLGNYEQALSDYDQAEAKNFDDKCSLLLSRGNVKRLTKDYAGALDDYTQALERLDPQDKVNRIRALSFVAFCEIDLYQFEEAEHTIEVARGLNLEVVDEKEKLILLDPSNGHATDDYFYTQRTNWILHYHWALCRYMKQDFIGAEKVIRICMQEDMVRYAPDEDCIGNMHFFIAQSYMRLANFTKAMYHFEQCGKTHWIDNEHNKFLLQFSIAKNFQCLRRHEDAIAGFNTALKLRSNDPYCLFRRAWSYKALGNYVAAGDDFESARLIRPNDPNFAIDYKKIAKFEFMIIPSDPDLVEAFPPLLPVPGMKTR